MKQHFILHIVGNGQTHEVEVFGAKDTKGALAFVFRGADGRNYNNPRALRAARDFILSHVGKVEYNWVRVTYLTANHEMSKGKPYSWDEACIWERCGVGTVEGERIPC